MKIGSLFSGIGGLELGLERAGIGHTTWQAEANPFCLQVLEKHWPEAERFHDVRQISPKTAAAVDIVCGGFPCQDISYAGNGAGLSGERSGLWFEFARIIREFRPRFVIVENVSALLGRGGADVLGTLATLGYDARWDCIPAQAVGAPHRRDRLFILAWLADTESEPDSEPDSEPGTELFSVRAEQKQPRGRGSEDMELAYAYRGRQQVVRIEGLQRKPLPDPNGRHGQEWPPLPNDLQAWGRVQADSQPAVCRITNGLPNRVDRLIALGNAVVPQVAEVVGGWVQEQLRSAP